MIPKIIHYCWFGQGEMPRLMKKCLKSWKKFCPDWKIVRWDEDSFDVNSTLWTKQAYETKKYAFVADYVRLKALYEMGGVYLDTDVELVKPLDAFVTHEAFIGFENTRHIASCLIGACPQHPVVQEWLRWYQDRDFVQDGTETDEPNVVHMTDTLIHRGLEVNNVFQTVDGMAVYPQTWFCPQNIEGENRELSANTVAIHYFDSSWRTENGRRAMKRAKFHSTKFYKTLEWLRYLPNRIVRGIFGDDAIDALKKKLGK